MSLTKKRPFIMNISVSDLERRHFRAAAKRQNLPITTWMRKALYQAVRESQPVLESAS